MVSPPVFAADLAWPGALSTYGTPGLIDMPSAIIQEDAEVAATLSFGAGQTKATFTFQVMPRLSGSFRYSKIDDFSGLGGDLYDRSFDFRYTLLEESDRLPAVVLGFQDVLGTGVFSSEYFVATKSLTPRLQVTGGIGWGRMASRGEFDNPFGIVSGAFDTRNANDVGRGGKLTFKNWFRGDAALFAGVAWRASDRLTLEAEYSSDAYDNEQSRGLVDPSSPLNFGLTYRLTDAIDLSLTHRLGNETGLVLSTNFNPKRPPGGATPDKAPPAVLARADGPSGPGDQLEAPLRVQLSDQGIALEHLNVVGDRATVQIRNTRWRSEPQAIGRTVRVLSRVLPAEIEAFRIVTIDNGMALSAIDMRRRDVEELEHAPDGAWLSFVRADISDAADLGETAIVSPRFDWSLTPYIDTELFDPDGPLRADVGVRAQGRLAFGNGVFVSGSIRKKVLGSLDNSVRASTSVLPKVRSENALYNREGDPALEYLALERFGRPGRDLYSRVSFGYLEKMYGGLSAELLWKPVDSRLGIGGELNYVKQRDFDQQFGFQDYETATGHVSAYYDLGNGFHTQLDVGRYLAGDWGATLSVDREFENGIRIGGFATLTDVSFDDFGEGSFDKGITIEIPITWITGEPARNSFRTTIRPVLRDGGARLNVPNRLYETVRPWHSKELGDEWGRVFR